MVTPGSEPAGWTAQINSGATRCRLAANERILARGFREGSSSSIMGGSPSAKAAPRNTSTCRAMTMFGNFRPIALALLVAPSLSACILVADHDGKHHWSVSTDDSGASKADGDKKETKDKKKELAAKEAKLALAKLENEIEELDAKSKQTEASLALEHARRSLDMANKALEHFRSVEKPNKLADAELDIEKASFHDVELKQDELNELMAMFKKETFAESTKDLVVKRDTRDLEFAKRAQDLAKQRLDSLKNQELAKELFDKEEEAKKAQEQVAKAEVEVRKADLGMQVAQMKAKLKLEEIEKGDDKGAKGGDKDGDKSADKSADKGSDEDGEEG
jgi:hypothetical protein